MHLCTRHASDVLRPSRLLFYLTLLLATIPLLHAQEITWQQMNGPKVGASAVPAVHPLTGDLYIITIEGLMRSTDRGATWSVLPPGDGYTPIGTLVIGPTGTFYGLGSGARIGRSTDNGASWMSADSGLPATYYQRLAIDSSGDLYVVQLFGGIYRSTNDGELWERVDTGFTARNLAGFRVAPDGALLVARIDSGLYRSTDKGVSWNHIEEEIAPRGISQVIGESSSLFAASSDRLFRSLDSGGTWQMIDSIPIAGSNQITGLVLNQASGTLLVAFYNGTIVRSTDNGTSWTNLGSPFGGIPAYSLVADDLGTVIAVTNYDGMFRSTDDGGTWETVDLGFVAAYILDMDVSVDGVVVASTQGGSVHRSTDYGMNWENLGRPAGNIDIRRIVITQDGAIIGGTQGYGFYRSTDDGNTWSPINTGLRSRFDSTANDLLVARNGAIFAATGNSVFRSEDGGDSWWRVSNGLTTITSVSLAEMPNGDLFVGTADYNGGLYHSTDNGATWNETTLMGTGVSNVVVSPRGKILVVRRDSVMVSSDTGRTWSAVRTGITVNQMAVNATGDIFISFGSDLIRSTDDGATWISVYEGIPANTTIPALSFLPDGRMLLGTYGRSVFRSEGSTLGVEGGASGFAEQGVDVRLVPNPLAGRTTFHFVQPTAGEVSIRIIDPRGGLVRNIVVGYRSAGEQSVVCDLDGESSGTYFYECRIGSAVARGIMLLAQ